jgi:phosphatidylserine/phosphatidylglycerophosphate/cardiolipin synthase-like enzyme
MNELGELSYGEAQEAGMELRRETYPGLLNVTFTRGFVSSQAFIDRVERHGRLSTLLPSKAKEGLTFIPTHPKIEESLAWMGFETREALLQVLDNAINDPLSQVRVIAYDLSEPGIVGRLQRLQGRLKIIIDDSKEHKEEGSGENQAEALLVASAGRENVKRQHMGGLQHNKLIVVDSVVSGAVVYGSTNFSWRGFFVQANNAVILRGERAVQLGLHAFDHYWHNGSVDTFGRTPSAQWQDLGLANIEAKVSFSPHIASNALLQSIADDIREGVKSSLFYSLAFLHQTPGVILQAINKVTNDPAIFVYGMADRRVGGIDLQKPDGNVMPVFPSQLSAETLPEPFKTENAGGRGNRLHHKFLVLDFDRPTARVYLGSYNFSKAADIENGENLLLIKNPQIAVAYMVEALRLFDHYHFRVKQMEAGRARKKLALATPPKDGEDPWWKEDFIPGTIKSRDRLLFS